MNAKADALNARQATLEAELAAADSPQPAIHPNLAGIYRERVAMLREALDREDTREEAGAALRTLIEAIRLVPENGKLRIDLHGELGAILALANEKPATKRRGGSSVKAVAGTGFEPVTFRL